MHESALAMHVFPHALPVLHCLQQPPTGEHGTSIVCAYDGTIVGMALGAAVGGDVGVLLGATEGVAVGTPEGGALG